MHTSSPNVTSPRLHRRGRPHNRTCVTLCFVYIIPPCLCPPLSLSFSFPLSLLSFRIPREYPSPRPRCPPAPYRRHVWHEQEKGSAKRRRRMRMRRWWRKWRGGTEGWFKRVNTSQLRSWRTLLGHWSDRDALHPLPLLPPPSFASSSYLPPALVLPMPFLRRPTFLWNRRGQRDKEANSLPFSRYLSRIIARETLSRLMMARFTLLAVLGIASTGVSLSRNVASSFKSSAPNVSFLPRYSLMIDPSSNSQPAMCKFKI